MPVCFYNNLLWEKTMKPVFFAAVLVILSAPLAHASVINLHMSNFKFSGGVGGTLNLQIDDAILDTDESSLVGEFQGAIKGGSCKDGINGVEFNLDFDGDTKVVTNIFDIPALEFSGYMKDGLGNSARFLLWFEGRFSPDVTNSLAGIDYLASTWKNSVIFSINGENVDFLGGNPGHFEVTPWDDGGHNVPEPCTLLMMFTGFLGICLARFKRAK